MFYYIFIFIFILVSASTFGVGDDSDALKEQFYRNIFGDSDSDLESSNEALSEEDALQEDEGGMNAEQFIAFISKKMHENDKNLSYIGGKENEVDILYYVLIAAYANAPFRNDAFFVRNGLKKPMYLNSLTRCSTQNRHINAAYASRIEGILGIKVVHKWALHLNNIKEILKNFFFQISIGKNKFFYVDDKVAFERIINEKDVKSFLEVEFKLRKNANKEMGVVDSESINEEMSEGDACGDSDSESSDEAGMDATKFIAFISEEMHKKDENLSFIGGVNIQHEQEILYFILSLVYGGISIKECGTCGRSSSSPLAIKVPSSIQTLKNKKREAGKICEDHLNSIKEILGIQLAIDNNSTYLKHLKSIFEIFCWQIKTNMNKFFYVGNPLAFTEMIEQKNYELLKKVEFKLKNEAMLEEDEAGMNVEQFIDFISKKMHENDETLSYIGGKENEVHILYYGLIVAYANVAFRDDRFFKTIPSKQPKCAYVLRRYSKQQEDINTKHASRIEGILGIEVAQKDEVDLNDLKEMFKSFFFEIATGNNKFFYVDDKVAFTTIMNKKDVHSLLSVKFKFKLAENANKEIEENVNQAMAVEVYGDNNSENEPNREEESSNTNQNLIYGVDIDDLINAIYTDDVNTNEAMAVEVNDGSGTESNNDLPDEILRDDHHEPQQYIPFLPGADQEEDSEKKRSSKNSCSAEQLLQLQKEWGDDDDAEMEDESSESNETPSATANGSSSQETNGRNGSSKNHSNTRKKSAPVADWPCQAAAEYDEALVIRLLNLGEVTEDVDLQEVIEFDPLWTPEGSTDQRAVAFLRLVYQRTGNRQNLNHFFDFYALTLRHPDLWEQVVAGENRMPEADLRADIHLLEESALNAVVDLNKQTENANNNAVALYVAMQALHVLNYHQFIHMWFANFIPVLFRMAQQLEPHRRSVAMY